MKFILTLLAMSILLSCRPDHEIVSDNTQKVLVVVKRNYDPPAQEDATITVDWDQLIAKMPRLNTEGFQLTDQHFGRTLAGTLVNTDADPQPEILNVQYPFTSAEPQYAFTISVDPNTQQPEIQTGNHTDDSRFSITMVEDYTTFFANDTINNWSERIFESSL